ncbi:hypothetical protein LEP1GSC193_2388 [Leptospira alstonii serovar Pingchang str. 80-412]|uniref:Uncharacterized protein n=2 Tax=Leptospira alstonii TaxID=28452 RepID=M6DI16_9LEPT|nr:hypothetical protein LEP1GSC194_2426 [Leptospira alstonii serovar Sichuan str. 79601]EQA81144.1 hypothetical protein LEP1GSC193_2388 [Leptospira alstonii serovar Pingchang str. 80-412]
MSTEIDRFPKLTLSKIFPPVRKLPISIFSKQDPFECTELKDRIVLRGVLTIFFILDTDQNLLRKEPSSATMTDHAENQYVRNEFRSLP